MDGPYGKISETAAKNLQGDCGGLDPYQTTFDGQYGSTCFYEWCPMSNPLCSLRGLGNSRGILVTFFASFSGFLGRILSIIPRGDATAENEATCSDLDVPLGYSFCFACVLHSISLLAQKNRYQSFDRFVPQTIKQVKDDVM